MKKEKKPIKTSYLHQFQKLFIKNKVLSNVLTLYIFQYINQQFSIRSATTLTNFQFSSQKKIKYCSYKSPKHLSQAHS